MTTPLFELLEWQQNQAEPHVIVNTAMRVIECLAQLVIKDRDLYAPPGSNTEGDCYIPADPATGDWEGHENDVAMFINGAWVFRTPKHGWEAYVEDEDVEIRYYADSSPPAWQIKA